MNSKFKGALAGFLFSAMAFGGAAQAGFLTPIYIDVGTDFNADGDTVTDPFTQLGFGQLLATSIYGDLDNSGTISSGDTIYDTNITSILQTYFATGNYTAIDGSSSVSLDSDFGVGNQQITGLLPLSTLFDDVEGFGTSWGLYLEYELFGTVDGLFANSPFDSGYIDVRYVQPGASIDERVLRIDITDSNLELANLELFGTVSYADLTDPVSSFVQNFFNFESSGQSFYDLTVNQSVVVRSRLDTNTDPAIPTDDQLVAFSGVGSGGTENVLIRQTTLDGSIGFQQVPEPATLALLGFGLIGLGMSRIRRRQQTA